MIRFREVNGLFDHYYHMLRERLIEPGQDMRAHARFLWASGSAPANAAECSLPDTFSASLQQHSTPWLDTPDKAV